MSVPASPRHRALFFSEAVSLAHVTRPRILAESLPQPEWDVHFACGAAYASFLPSGAFTLHDLKSISPARFLDRLARGMPLYSEAELHDYVEQDIALLDEIRPDVVAGDFRLSLAVSARLAKVPYLALTNAHWSPYFTKARFPLPEHPLARIVGVPLATMIFQRVQPFAFALHARPMNRVRRRYGLPSIPDLRELYTEGDWTLYADTPGLVPTAKAPVHHRYIGPLVWAPEMPLPSWWNDLPTDRATIYVTLGSTGQVDLLPGVLESLASLGASIVVATAGRRALSGLPSNVWTADYLPGQTAAARADIVICNGGSGTAYQALAFGKPVVGICSNMDQHLTMGCVEAAGAGILLRAGSTSGAAVREAAAALLTKPAFADAAERVRREFAEYDPRVRFPEVARQALAAG